MHILVGSFMHHTFGTVQCYVSTPYIKYTPGKILNGAKNKKMGEGSEIFLTILPKTHIYVD